MWLAKQLNTPMRQDPLCGFFALEEARPVLQTGEPLPLSGMLTPYGYYALPPVCTEAAALPVEGEYLLAGETVRTGLPTAGEILIRSAGGATIRLGLDGVIELNGVQITPNGQIITPTKEA